MKIEIKRTFVIKLSLKEARHLVEEASDIKVGSKPLLHELLDKLEEELEKSSDSSYTALKS